MSAMHDSETPLTKLECEHVIAVMRRYRDAMVQRRLELQEHERAGYDGVTKDSILAAMNEIALLSGILAKLWYQYRVKAK